ncbi:MAG: dihydroneopterin aldolase [Ignavibacteria bacterium GWB2_35_12]|nr:MAG: dihydroneopterin aldolase [Ignavibacteria bacterium GWA2_35_8]OGU40396.1 MAG: dihydroneopterin aldolase [Ignavibacteria bacterium GWB2_35_12]OGU92189.1 MAG: dihydroneopterin aldolase [Ignavibacteria bacterium RIFOXYA2_FULL_35_10]OGV22532.1 MAG: dihydroneopterin aldolase [Ignavibacteria bacterium RIFOXYC2_FULL_35_21]
MKEASMMRLSIKSAQFYSYHGVKAEEQVLGGKYEVDLDLFYDATQAIVNDDVKYAINYEEAFYCIEEVIGGDEGYNLVETIANEILQMAMEKFPNLEKATVRVRKMSVPIRRVVNYIEAEQTITRKN